jgi:small subunit ribosomal protein S21
MIIIPIKDGESIERALKKFKRKFEKTGIIKEIRERQAYKKPSIAKRELIKKAVYIEKLRKDEQEA